MPAKLSLECEHWQNQNQDCGQALRPVAGAILPSIIGVAFPASEPS